MMQKVKGWGGGIAKMLETIQTMDSIILLWIQEFINIPLLDDLMIAYTTVGDAGMLYITISIGLLCSKKTRKMGILALAAMLLGLLCNNVILKHLVSRPRPYLMVEGLLPLMSPPDPNSFPSGHTCAAFACAYIWMKTCSKRWMGAVAMTMAIVMGYSRLHVGVHYLTDVLTGALVGTLCAMVVWSIYRWKFQDKEILNEG